jgi:hypothetical protein
MNQFRYNYNRDKKEEQAGAPASIPNMKSTILMNIELKSPNQNKSLWLMSVLNIQAVKIHTLTSDERHDACRTSTTKYYEQCSITCT